MCAGSAGTRVPLRDWEGACALCSSSAYQCLAQSGFSTVYERGESVYISISIHLRLNFILIYEIFYCSFTLVFY